MDPGRGLEVVRKRFRTIAEGLEGLKPHEFRTYGNVDAVKMIGREGA
jgi:hypothetical protein